MFPASSVAWLRTQKLPEVLVPPPERFFDHGLVGLEIVPLSSNVPLPHAPEKSETSSESNPDVASDAVPLALMLFAAIAAPVTAEAGFTPSKPKRSSATASDEVTGT